MSSFFRRSSVASEQTYSGNGGGKVTPDPKADNNIVVTEPVAMVPTDQKGSESDAVWGDVGAEGPNYKGLGWIRAAVLETKTQIGLGVLGLPAVLDTFGFVPGLIIIFFFSVMITWTDYVIGTFKRNHPDCYTMADVGYIFLGPVGREIWGFGYWLLLTAIAGSGMLSFSIALNAVSLHVTCTIVWVAVGAIIVFFISSIQTLGKISWLGWVGVASITASVITLAVSVGVSDRPSAAPQTGPFYTNVQAVKQPSFVDAMNSINVVMFAYAGTPNFMQIASEMKDTRDYTKSVILCQGFVTLVYVVIGSVVYHYTGQYIASPALGSAGVLMKRVCYGIAIPGLLVGCMINVHLPAKYVFVRILSGTQHLSRNTKTHYLVWYGCVAFNCLISFIIAESIPVFDDLLSVIGAILGTFLCIQTECIMWLYDNLRRPRGARTLRWGFLVFMNFFFQAVGWYIMGAGTYAAAIAIRNDVADGNQTSHAFGIDGSSSGGSI